jgi:hypothetical protein
MRNQQNFESAAVWRAAQHRRGEDLAIWLGHSAKQPGKGPEATGAGSRPRLVLARGMTIIAIAFAAIISVSAVVQAERPAHVALRPTGPMPQVNVP